MIHIWAKRALRGFQPVAVQTLLSSDSPAVKYQVDLKVGLANLQCNNVGNFESSMANY